MKNRLAALLLLLCLAPSWAFGRLVTLNYVRADLPFVLKKLAPALGKNIVLGPEVQGSVTLNVRDVPAEKALGLMLAMQETQLVYKVVGNTVVVGSPHRLSTIDDNTLR